MSRRHRGVLQGAPSTREIPAPAGGVVIETFVPWKMVRRGVRTRIVTPLGQAQEFTATRPRETAGDDNPLLRALGLAHHWQRLLDEGRCTGLREIAEAEGIDLGRASRILRLTQLAPRVLDAALRGEVTVGLSDLLQGFDDRWGVQESTFHPHHGATRTPLSSASRTSR